VEHETESEGRHLTVFDGGSIVKVVSDLEGELAMLLAPTDEPAMRGDEALEGGVDIHVCVLPCQGEVPWAFRLEIE